MNGARQRVSLDLGEEEAADDRAFDLDGDRLQKGRLNKHMKSHLTAKKAKKAKKAKTPKGKAKKAKTPKGKKGKKAKKAKGAFCTG